VWFQEKLTCLICSWFWMHGEMIWMAVLKRESVQSKANWQALHTCRRCRILSRSLRSWNAVWVVVTCNNDDDDDVLLVSAGGTVLVVYLYWELFFCVFSTSLSAFWITIFVFVPVCTAYNMRTNIDMLNLVRQLHYAWLWVVITVLLEILY